MNNRIRARAHLSSLALAVALLAGLFGTARPAFAHPVAQASDPIATVMALADAFNKADNASMDALLDPSFEHVTVNPPAGLPPEAVRQNREQFMREASVGGITVTLSNCKLSSATTVVCDESSAGPALPFPHPYTATGTFTVQDGKVTRLEEIISEQTLRDLEALLAAQPGMPTTGLAGPQTLLTALVLGLLLLAFGFMVRRRASSYTQ